MRLVCMWHQKPGRQATSNSEFATLGLNKTKKARQMRKNWARKASWGIPFFDLECHGQRAASPTLPLCVSRPGFHDDGLHPRCAARL